MPLPDVGSRVRIVQVENPDLEQFIGLEGFITKFLADSIMVRLDRLPYVMEFTLNDVVLL